MNYHVKTHFNPDVIIQEVILDTSDLRTLLPIDTLIKQIADLKDQGVRQALINLGWTPPSEVSHGCFKSLAPGQWWMFCGESDMGQTPPVLCTECGGQYKLHVQA